MLQVVEKPIWAIVRAKAEDQELLEKAFVVLEQSGIRVERSYGD